MKSARLIVLVIALAAGVLAWMMARNLGSSDEQAPVVVQEQLDLDQVLVAAKDLGPGSILSEEDLRWQRWPLEGVGAGMITRSARNGAPADLVGSVTRSSFSAGEPIRETKLAKAGRGGYLSAILPSGKRAVATRTSPQTGAGGFILPNDRVDVIVTQRAGEGPDSFNSSTVLENVRVLAIDQTVEEQDGRAVVVGNVATLELTPGEAETLARAEQQGDVSLTLRSILDGDDDNQVTQSGRSSTVNVVKFGVPSRVNTN